MLFTRFFLLMTCLLFAQSALAHKLNVFTYIEGKQVFVEGYFADGKKAKNSHVKVYNEQREIISEGTTNDAGEFNFTATEIASLRIVLDAGMGHVGEYTIPVSDFSEAVAPSANTRAIPSENTSTPTQATTATAANQITSTANQEDIKIIVDQAVATAIKPLVREISELKNKTSFSDIIGGLGFILGALGLFAYLKARKPTI